MVDVAPGTIVVWSDLACPWAHLAVYRLLEGRRRLGLDDKVVLDHRAFPLEVYNEQATPKPVLDSEVPVLGALEPDAGWQVWGNRDWRYPVTILLPLEAVQAAKAQGLAAGEELDRALRLALFAESRCISMRHVVLEVARSCQGVDEGAISEALDDGRCRATVMAQQRAAADAGVQGSPHLFLPDGTDVHNPGITKRWEGEPGAGFPVVEADDPSVYEKLLLTSAGR